MTDREAKQIIDEKSRSSEWLGKFGEAIWKNVIHNSGWYYISLAKIAEGGAPLARGENGNLILPDYDACREGRSILIEAKAKKQSIVYRIKRQVRHGINQENYQHYLEFSRQQGKRCCIGLVELYDERLDGSLVWSGSLLFETLSNLGDPRSEHLEQPRKVYWQRKQFVDLDSFSPRELLELASGRLKRSYSSELEQILFPMRQKSLIPMG